MNLNRKSFLNELYVYLSALQVWPDTTIKDKAQLKQHLTSLLEFIQEDKGTENPTNSMAPIIESDSLESADTGALALLRFVATVLAHQRSSVTVRIEILTKASYQLQHLFTLDDFCGLKEVLRNEISRLEASLYNKSSELLDCPFCGARPKGTLGPMFGVEVSAICCSNSDCLASARQVSKEQWNTRVVAGAVTPSSLS